MTPTRTPPTFTEVDAHQFKLALEILQSFVKKGVMPSVLVLGSDEICLSVLSWHSGQAGSSVSRNIRDLTTITPQTLAEMEQEAWNSAAKSAREAAQ
jgi:hypothetical protein